MEQQQNELFAMIGELTYKLQLAQRENEQLADEVRRKSELCTSILNDRNRLFSMNTSSTEENAKLKEKLKKTEEERNAVENSIGIFRPQRQTCADVWTDTDLRGFYYDGDRGNDFDTITDEQMARFYGENGAIETCDEESLPKWA